MTKSRKTRSVKSPIKPKSKTGELMQDNSLFMKIIGAILVAVTLWIGSTTYNVSQSTAILTVQSATQATAMLNLESKAKSLDDKFQALVASQYSKTDALRDSLAIQTKIDALELRIRTLEAITSTSGSIKDPIVVMIQGCKDEIALLKTQLAAVTQDIKNNGKFQELKEKP